MLGLIEPALVVGDLGCGTGQLTEIVAPHVRRVISVDGSDDMLAAARQRLSGATNVDIRQGELESLPIESGELDVAMFSLVLHYSPEPPRALAEVGRVVRTGGRVSGRHASARPRGVSAADGSCVAWFLEGQTARLLAGAGFEHVRVRMLPVEADAKGPALFAAMAVKQ